MRLKTTIIRTRDGANEDLLDCSPTSRDLPYGRLSGSDDSQASDAPLGEPVSPTVRSSHPSASCGQPSPTSSYITTVRFPSSAWCVCLGLVRETPVGKGFLETWRAHRPDSDLCGSNAGMASRSRRTGGLGDRESIPRYLPRCGYTAQRRASGRARDAVDKAPFRKHVAAGSRKMKLNLPPPGRAPSRFQSTRTAPSLIGLRHSLTT